MNIDWNANDYKKDFSFVPAYGEAVMDLLTVQPGSRVVDLGCGNGTLTKKLSERGYQIIGVDASAEMLAKARKDYPDLQFQQGDALTFHLDQPADAIFSNAVFHWIDKDKQDALLDNIASNLKSGGELVFEFGGKDCGEAVHSTLEHIFAKRGRVYPRPLYFPTIGEYAPLVEKHGMLVKYATLFDRPTPQKGEHGLANWIRMFVHVPFIGISEEEKDAIIAEAEKRLRSHLCPDGHWFVDYTRIRMRAIKL